MATCRWHKRSRLLFRTELHQDVMCLTVLSIPWANRVVDSSPDLVITQGKKVLEVRPNVGWNKGKALLFLLERFGLSNGADVLPMYIGDDRTDEDAFQVRRVTRPLTHCTLLPVFVISPLEDLPLLSVASLVVGGREPGGAFERELWIGTPTLTSTLTLTSCWDACAGLAQVLSESGRGIGIFVSQRPRETAATYTLRDPRE
eukprot:652906-Pyramimonas_sp.AAC.1